MCWNSAAIAPSLAAAGLTSTPRTIGTVSAKALMTIERARTRVEEQVVGVEDDEVVKFDVGVTREDGFARGLGGGVDVQWRTDRARQGEGA